MHTASCSLLVPSALVWVSLLACTHSGADRVDPLRLPQAEFDNVAQMEKMQIPPKFWSEADRLIGATESYLLGEYLIESGHLQKAQGHFEQAYKLDEDPYLGVRSLQARIEARPGTLQTAETRDDAKRLLLLFPRDPGVQSLMGSMLLQRGELKRAKQHFQQALQLDVGNQAALVQLIHIYQREHDRAGVLKLATQLRQRSPELKFAWTVAFATLLEGKQYRQGAELARKSFAFFPTDYEMLVYAAAFSQRLQHVQDISQQIDRFYLQDERIDENEIQQRNRILIQVNGGAQAALQMLAGWERFLAHPGAGFSLQQALLHWHTKDFAQAEKIMRAALELYPNNDDLHYFLGLGYELQEKKQEARQIFQQIPRTSKFFVSARYHLSRIYQHEKNTQMAIQVVTEGLEQQPTSVEMFLLAGQVLTELGRSDLAVTYLDKGVERFPRRSELLYQLSVAKLQSGDGQGAMRVLRQLVQLDPSHASGHNFLGYLYAEQGIFLEEAEKLLLRALRLRPGDPYYLDSLGWIYYRQGKLEKAFAFVTESHRKLPEQGIVLAHLAEIQYFLGKREEAKLSFQNALKMKLEAREREQVVAKIKELFPELLQPAS
ncbi:MAG: tetratricopeptide repeat protein [Zetaproteobacteria bacterium]|nr:tetratricopeptide repeat protein [Zetaproteobacteria bacterium]